MLISTGPIKLGLCCEPIENKLNESAVCLFFVDDEEQVIKSARISKVMHASAVDLINCDSQLRIPSWAVAIAFA